jgi:hypothetical protein
VADKDPTNGWNPREPGSSREKPAIAGRSGHAPAAAQQVRRGGRERRANGRSGTAQRSAFLNSNSFAASDSRRYLTFARPNGFAGSTLKIVLARGGLRSAAGPYL